MKFDVKEFIVANAKVMARPVQWDKDGNPTLYHTTCPSCGALQEIDDKYISIKCQNCKVGLEKTADGYICPFLKLPRTEYMI